MTDSESTIDFIHICQKERRQRLSLLAEKLHFQETALGPYKQDITEIMDFIKKIDDRIHNNEENNPVTALGQTFHFSSSSDLRALIILAVTRQNFQMNIILRHFIEFFIVSLWIEIGSQFTGGFNYYLESDKWKQYWNDSKHRITWSEIKGRLEEIKRINKKGNRNFYETYFATADESDFRLLLSLPICEQCRKDKSTMYYRYTVSLVKRITTQKVDRKAIYKTGYAYQCHFCKQKALIKGYMMGLLDTRDMIEMTKVIAADQVFTTNIDTLKQIYDRLSADFVHFGTKAIPDEEPGPVSLGKNNETVSLWGFEGVLFCLKILLPLTNFYFRKQRLEQKR
jgi:hypothetical protein